MAKFSYSAKASDGHTVSGTLEAVSQATVLQGLRQKGLVVIGVRQLRDSAKRAFGVRVKMDDLAIFCRQMATLVDAGIPIVGGLDAVAEQLENKKLREVVLEVRDAVEAGAHLTHAIGKHGTVFSPMFVNMLKAGEASGHLAEVMGRLATYLEKSAALQRKIQSACVYPAIVMLMAAGVSSVLVLKVIPAFKEVFDSFGAQLPLPTLMLLAFSDFAQHWFLAIVLAVGGAFTGLRRWITRSRKARLLFDRAMLRLPLVGSIVRKVAIAKFSRTLATLTRSGVQILSALEIVSEAAGNCVVADAIMKVRASIREGQNIANPLAESGVFPPIVVRMIAVGEQTGRLDEMLEKIAAFYEDQVDAAVSGLTSTLEPLIIAVMGVVIGGIVLAIFLPIFQMTSVIH